jgi:hypothetical protein
MKKVFAILGMLVTVWSLILFSFYLYLLHEDYKLRETRYTIINRPLEWEFFIAKETTKVMDTIVEVTNLLKFNKYSGTTYIYNKDAGGWVLILDTNLGTAPKEKKG